MDGYHALLAHYGDQGWWPITPENSVQPEYNPAYKHARPSNESIWEIIVGALLTQNTNWRNVEKALINLHSNQIRSPERLLQADPPEVQAWIRPAGYYRQKTERIIRIAQWITQRGMDTLQRLSLSELRVEILSQYGIGDETADSILLYGFHRPIPVVDAYTFRIFLRTGMMPIDSITTVSGKKRYEWFQKRILESLPPLVPVFNEFHALLVKHAVTVCKKRNPWCTECGIQKICPQISY